MFQPVTPQYFQSKSALDLARDLLGKTLVHQDGGFTLAIRIVETEAYLQSEPASHSYNGLSERNYSMFAEPGTIYVYKIYGMHFCLNISAFKQGVGDAVLIRAGEPIAGIETMQLNRLNVKKQTALTNGPGKLCQAMQIDLRQNGLSAWELPLFVAEPVNYASFEITQTRRVGITKAADLPYRFYISDSSYVSVQ